MLIYECKEEHTENGKEDEVRCDRKRRERQEKRLKLLQDLLVGITAGLVSTALWNLIKG